MLISYESAFKGGLSATFAEEKLDLDLEKFRVQ
jgi:hypothetical protein